MNTKRIVGDGRGLSTEFRTSGAKNVCAAVPLDTYLALLRLKAETGKSIYQLVREAIETYIAQAKIKPSQA